MLSHAYYDCNTQINPGEGENHTIVPRFVTSIVGRFSVSFVSYTYETKKIENQPKLKFNLVVMGFQM